MGKQYQHLSLTSREKIDVLKRHGRTTREIAEQLGVHKSTISRELRKNASAEYDCYVASRAHQRASKRKSVANRHERLKDPVIVAYVRQKIQEYQWSPELIAGRIAQDLPGARISHEAIYQYIYSLRLPDRFELVKHLARGHRMRKTKVAGRRFCKTKIPNRVSIEMRPAIVERRVQPGHWEGDSMVSRASKQALNTITERTSRLLLISRISRKGARETAQAIIQRLDAFPASFRRSITFDNGTENAAHERITSAIGIACYFAHPYCSYERGSNEQINGLIRRYLPKGTDFRTISDAQLQDIQNKINNRPRKCLAYKTPSEVASNLIVALRC